MGANSIRILTLSKAEVFVKVITFLRLQQPHNLYLLARAKAQLPHHWAAFE